MNNKKRIWNKWSRFIYFLLLILIMVIPIFSDAQGWIYNSLTIDISEGLDFQLSNEVSYNEITYMDPYMKNWQTSLFYNFSKNYYIGFAYKRKNTKKTEYMLAENRFSLIVGWKTKLYKKMDFDMKLSTEIRGFEDNLAENHLRFRLKFRLKAKIKIGWLKLKPFIAIEPFLDTILKKINRYRFYLGTVFVLSKNIGLVINYLREGTKGKTTINALNTGFEIKL